MKKAKLSDFLTVSKKVFGCIYYGNIVEKPVMARFGIHMVDDGTELFNSLCENADKINNLEVNEQFYLNMNRDNETEKSIIIRLE